MYDNYACSRRWFKLTMWLDNWEWVHMANISRRKGEFLRDLTFSRYHVIRCGGLPYFLKCFSLHHNLVKQMQLCIFTKRWQIMTNRLMIYGKYANGSWNICVYMCCIFIWSLKHVTARKVLWCVTGEYWHACIKVYCFHSWSQLTASCRLCKFVLLADRSCGPCVFCPPAAYESSYAESNQIQSITQFG